MLIQCPACKTQAKLPESKEGAKVRCPECERVFVARPFGARRSKTIDPTRYVLIGIGVIVMLIIWNVSRGAPDQTEVVAAPVEEEPENEPVDLVGWDAPLTKQARLLHDLAFQRSEAEIPLHLDKPSLWENFRNLGKDEGAELDERDWSDLSLSEQGTFMSNTVYALTRGEDYELVGAWEPIEGGVEEELEDTAVVRLRVASREDKTQLDRYVDWSFVKRRGKWLVAKWERWISPAELAAMRANKPKKLTRRTLSDGSQVIEAEVKEVQVEDALPELPAEINERAIELCNALVDLEARPSVRTDARNELVALGKQAIPALLNKLVEIPLETDEQAMQLNLVHHCLTDITGYITTFNAHDALGGSQERRESGIKQWFGWYERRFKSFTTKKEGDDPLLDLKPRNERERREFEKIKREQEAGGG